MQLSQPVQRRKPPAALQYKELKVFGVEGLRVCDASAMPSQITGNLYATVIAMAEKASDMILKLEKKTPLET